MATIKKRGESYSVIYGYNGIDDNYKRQWEAYHTEVEAVERKALIDYYKDKNDNVKIRSLAEEYRVTSRKNNNIRRTSSLHSGEYHNDMNITLDEFSGKYITLHSRKNRLATSTYDNLVRTFKLHILPYFGKTLLSEITKKDIDEFIDHLASKKCSGSYSKDPNAVPNLSSATVKKIYSVLHTALTVAKEWGYIKEVPSVKVPKVIHKKREAWNEKQVADALNNMDDKLFHLAVHLIFICSLRPGEALGITINNIHLEEKYIDINQTMARVTENSLNTIKSEDVYRIFPRQNKSSKSLLALKASKTDASNRKVYLTDPLVKEINDRLEQIKSNNRHFRNDYNDYAL